MNALLDLLVSPGATRLGWTLLHFVWQGAAIGLLVGAALLALRGGSSRARSRCCLAGLVLMAVAPLATFAVLPEAPAREAAAPLVDGSFAVPAGSPAAPRVDALVAALPIVVAAWTLGVCALLLRTAVHLRRARRLVRRGTLAAPDWVVRLVDDLARRLGVRRRVRVVQSVLADTPSLVGWLSPVVLVPLGALDVLTPQQVRAILAHELAHVARHDYLVNLLQSVLEAVFFYHPAVWWLSHRLRVEREFCCDDLAVADARGALPYARALAALEAWRDALTRSPAAPRLSSQGGSLMDRIERLLEGPAAAPARRGRWGALSLATSAALVLAAGASAFAQDDGTAPAQTVRLLGDDGRVLTYRLVAVEDEAVEEGLDDGSLEIAFDAEPAQPAEEVEEVEEVEVLGLDPLGGWSTVWRATTDGAGGSWIVRGGDEGPWVARVDDGEQRVVRLVLPDGRSLGVVLDGDAVSVESCDDDGTVVVDRVAPSTARRVERRVVRAPQHETRTVWTVAPEARVVERVLTTAPRAQVAKRVRQDASRSVVLRIEDAHDSIVLRRTGSGCTCTCPEHGALEIVDCDEVELEACEEALEVECEPLEIVEAPEAQEGSDGHFVLDLRVLQDGDTLQLVPRLLPRDAPEVHEAGPARAVSAGDGAWTFTRAPGPRAPAARPARAAPPARVGRPAGPVAPATPAAPAPAARPGTPAPATRFGAPAPASPFGAPAATRSGVFGSPSAPVAPAGIF